MARRVIVLIEDDWEIAGSGAYNVASHQYVPALFLMNLCKRLKIRVTFMAEVAQQLAFRKFADCDANINVQCRLWEDTVRLMKQTGFDVQLHLHPQWLDAKFDDGVFVTGRNWNLATCPPAARRELLESASAYLISVVRQVDPDYCIHSFKAGAWGLQPWRELALDLRRSNIKLVLGLARGLRVVTDDFRADYTRLEEDTLPYYPDPEDVCRVSSKREDLMILPVGWARRGWLLKLLGARDALRRTAHDKQDMWHVVDGNQHAFPASPIEPRSNFLARLRKLMSLSGSRHLHLGGESFGVMKHSLDKAMDRLLRRPERTLPLLIESHTKSYWGSWSDIERFLVYLTSRYRDIVEFQTLTEFLELAQTGEVTVMEAAANSP